MIGCLGLVGGWGVGRWWLKGMRFPLEMTKCSKIDFGDGMQLCECTKSHWIVPFKGVNSMICELCFNKVITKKKKKKRRDHVTSSINSYHPHPPILFVRDSKFLALAHQFLNDLLAFCLAPCAPVALCSQPFLFLEHPKLITTIEAWNWLFHPLFLCNLPGFPLSHSLIPLLPLIWWILFPGLPSQPFQYVLWIPIWCR